MVELRLFAFLFVAAILFGCTSTPIQSTPTPTPGGSPTPFASSTPTQTATPTPTPLAQRNDLSFPVLYGCNNTGLSYTYHDTNPNAAEMQPLDTYTNYSQEEGGVIDGQDTVLKTVSIKVGNYMGIGQQWVSKTDCRCVKRNSILNGQVILSECTTYGKAMGDAGNPTIRRIGTEQVSVPAYSGPATKYHVTLTDLYGTYTSEEDVWVAESVPIPVKISDAVTSELANYSH